jgi:hypothetical protein
MSQESCIAALACQDNRALARAARPAAGSSPMRWRETPIQASAARLATARLTFGATQAFPALRRIEPHANAARPGKCILSSEDSQRWASGAHWAPLEGATFSNYATVSSLLTAT